MILSWLIWLLALAGVFALWILYPCRELLGAFLFLAVLPCASIFCAAIFGRRIRVTMEKGRILVSSCSLFPVRNLRFRIGIHHVLSGENRERVWNCSFEAGKSKAYDFRSFRLHCGENILTLSPVKTADVLGFVRFRVSRTLTLPVTVLPEIYPAAAEIRSEVWSFRTESRILTEEVGADPGQTVDIREFQDGDRLQQIHWKLSARRETLLVREWAEPQYPRILFLLTFGERIAVTPDRLDRFFSVLLSWSLALADQGCIHEIAWRNPAEPSGFSVRLIGDAEQVYRLRQTLAVEMRECRERLRNLPEKTLPMWELYRAGFPERRYAAVYEWRHDGVLMCEGAVAADLRDSNWKRRLAEEGQIF